MQVALLGALGLLLAVEASGAEAVGTVSCPGPVILGDTTIEAAGVLSWTVLDGDRLETLSSPALLILHGGRVLIVPHSKVRLEPGGAGILVLLAGSLYARCRMDCRMVIKAQDQSISLGAGQAAGISIQNGVTIIQRGPVSAPFPIPSSWLLRRFVYTWGVVSPEERK